MIRDSALLKRSLASNLKNIEEFCNETRYLLLRLGLEKHVFAVELLTREALTNAMVHGNRGDASLKVQCRVRVDDKWIIIRVKDEGAGFAWKKTSRQLPNPASPSGRGLRIYALYAARTCFNRRGNGVVLLRRIQKEEHMSKEEILIEGNSAHIAPQVNLVASTVGDMRTRLRDLIITQGIKDVTIELSGVKMIDSTGIGLLISTFNSLARTGGTFKVTGASKDIMELLRTMRLDHHFEIHGA